MRSFFGRKHDAPVEVDEIIFESDRTVVVCVDDYPYEMATTTYDGSPITHDVFIEIFPSTTSTANKAYMN